MQVALLMLSVLAAIQTEPKLAPRPATAPAIDEIIYKGFPFNRQITRAQLEAILGKSSGINTRRVTTPHRSAVEDISTLRFNGLVVELYEGKTNPSGTLATIELSDNRWHFPAKIRIGSTREDVIQLLGKPDIQRPSEIIYGCYDCVYDDKIHFILAGNKVSRIKWEFYLD